VEYRIAHGATGLPVLFWGTVARFRGDQFIKNLTLPVAASEQVAGHALASQWHHARLNWNNGRKQMERFGVVAARRARPFVPWKATLD
jgi:hypothetical protein